MTEVTTVVGDPARLLALRRLVLLDTPSTPAFDRLTRLASRVLRAPVALVSLVDVDRQWFKASYGLPEPIATARETPLTYSLCQYAMAGGEPLVIRDTLEEPTFSDHAAVRDLGVRAYAGAPLFSPDSFPIGALCVLDFVPRAWDDHDRANVEDIASIANREIFLHFHERREAHRRTWGAS